MGGKFIGVAVMDQQSEPEVYTGTTQSTINTGQMNYLFILVDDLNAKRPKLLSAWLLILLPDSPKVNLVPLFPLTSGKLQAAGPDISAMFTIDEDRIPNQGFFDRLSQQIWWDSYILMDEADFKKASSYLARIHEEGSGPAHNPVNEANQEPLVNLSEPLMSQVEQMTAICRQASKLSQPVELIELFVEFSSQGKTDIDRGEEIQHGVTNQHAGSQIVCDFPTLTLTYP